MLRRGLGVIAAAVLLVSLATAEGAKIKVIADQDSAGPQGTNFLSLLMLLKAPQIDLLGITTVSGDQYVDEGTVFALWATELTDRTDVPVIKGAEPPLVNSKREQEAREQLYGSYLGWHGCFNPDAPDPKTTWPPPGGYPKVKARPGRAAEFIVETIRANPGEVVLYAAGPLTNIAMAVRMDPGIVALTKAIYIMGGSRNGGPELNWWWDPEAASIVLREPWKKIVVTPTEIGEQVWSNAELMQRVARGRGKLAEYARTVYLDAPALPGTSMWSMMWDELTVASILDPSVITKTETDYLDVDTSHGPDYGHTVVWRQPTDVPEFFLPYSGPDGMDRKKWEGHLQPPAFLHPASVQVSADKEKFYNLFVQLMTR